CVVALVSLLASLARADVTVRAAAGRVDLEVRRAPLSQILDILTRETGMKVVYDGPAPIQLVTMSLSKPSLRDAVCGLLEGQGLNYALAGDATDVKVLLVITANPASLPRRTGPPSTDASRSTT